MFAWLTFWREVIGWIVNSFTYSAGFSVMSTLEPDVYLHLGREIRILRKQRKLSQSELAAAVSLTRTSVANIEAGRQKVLLHTFLQIAAALKVAPIKLLPATDSAEADMRTLVERYEGIGHEWVARSVLKDKGR